MRTPGSVPASSKSADSRGTIRTWTNSEPASTSASIVRRGLKRLSHGISLAYRLSMYYYRITIQSNRATTEYGAWLLRRRTGVSMAKRNLGGQFKCWRSAEIVEIRSKMGESSANENVVGRLIACINERHTEVMDELFTTTR